MISGGSLHLLLLLFWCSNSHCTRVDSISDNSVSNGKWFCGVVLAVFSACCDVGGAPLQPTSSPMFSASTLSVSCLSRHSRSRLSEYLTRRGWLSWVSSLGSMGWRRWSVFGASCVRPAPNIGSKFISMTIGRCRELKYCSCGTPILVMPHAVRPIDAYVHPVRACSSCG